MQAFSCLLTVTQFNWKADQETVVEAAEHGTAKLRCEVEGEGQPIMRWMRNGQEVVPDGLRVFMDRDGIVLTIADVSVDDEGNYVCEAQSSSGYSQPISRTITLNILGKCQPTSRTITLNLLGKCQPTSRILFLKNLQKMLPSKFS